MKIVQELNTKAAKWRALAADDEAVAARLRAQGQWYKARVSEVEAELRCSIADEIELLADLFVLDIPQSAVAVDPVLPAPAAASDPARRED